MTGHGQRSAGALGSRLATRGCRRGGGRASEPARGGRVAVEFFRAALQPDDVSELTAARVCVV